GEIFVDQQRTLLRDNLLPIRECRPHNRHQRLKTTLPAPTDGTVLAVTDAPAICGNRSQPLSGLMVSAGVPVRN
ncbi:MAG TPA: hypothetical protein VGC05_14800, partial [Mycobacterium sp.]